MVGEAKNPRANVAELLARAQKPAEEALRLHPYYRGKLEVTPKCAIESCDDFAVWYSPGVAAPTSDRMPPCRGRNALRAMRKGHEF